ncbi:unnamed protein product [Didymodactylos carnosus]|uniref:NADP-dependent oxidoreductase domain-containing protein n=1 Tax=Didymodactylos carnosus TaxID=1234261 RepID=A0A814W1P2_9BILA|nr:unnamed protein product [Didymodactylos carnosus]CAF1194996.1 unnamed protein product [Didymodactylos carnosus]CAF3637087.1 unnamed protein product [Didymodactylos carnosus]CAF3959467.1 unnamed protein product [Didymodactylos carnosus]
MATSSSSNTRTVELNNGIKIPQLALGTYLTSDNEIAHVVKTALEAGYRHLDCAWLYGNEKGVGQGIREAIKESNGKLKREDIYITAKIWNTFHRANFVAKAFDISSKDLGLEYIDLFLIHWPVAFDDQGDPTKTENVKIADDIDYLETWQAMEKLVDEGKVKSIGLSNFTEEQIERVWHIAKHKPVVNQVELHPYCQNKALQTFCDKYKIKLQAYAPLGAKERSWAENDDPMLMNDPIIEAIAKKHQKHTALILLAYIMQRGIICVAKSSNEKRLKTNLEALELKLDEDDMKQIEENIKIKFRYYLFEDAKKSKYYPLKDWKQEKNKNGGQTGVDRSALDLAIQYSIDHGGWCPRGRKAEDGVINEKYQLKETPSDVYSERTEWNVRDSDGTLVLICGDQNNIDTGTQYTIDITKKYDKPLLIVDLEHQDVLIETVVDWLKQNHIKILNIAGPREQNSPRIYQKAHIYLRQLFKSFVDE